MSKNNKKKSKSWIIILSILIILSLVGYFIPKSTGNVAIIELSGVITTQGSDGLFVSVPGSDKIVNLIQEAQQDPNIKAIVIAINSPGGSPVASKEIVDQIKSSDKLTISYIRDIGASGGYWVASATDRIFADELSVVGSVGVNAAYLEFSGLLERYNVSYVGMTGGEFKDIGSPFKELSETDEKRMTEKINVLHDFFLNDVKENRQLTDEEVLEIKEADFYIGLQAINLNLIDEFGGEAKALSYIEQNKNIIANVVEYKVEIGFLDLFSSTLSEQSFNMGKGIGTSMFNKENNFLMLK